MIIVMSPNATKENLQRVIQKIESAGLKTHISEGAEVTIVGVIGEKSKIA
ncbi:MAG: 3-deoxy-7-phosphoheptulonate synthase, partial [Selenomonas sp.]|nr:3-deoxy-7-phosphoheptulonate synthase [Selenomonas sp.]